MTKSNNFIIPSLHFEREFSFCKITVCGLIIQFVIELLNFFLNLMNYIAIIFIHT